MMKKDLLLVNKLNSRKVLMFSLDHSVSWAVAFNVVCKRERIILFITLYGPSIFKLNRNKTLLRLFCYFIAEVTVNQEIIIVGVLPTA